MSAAAPDPAPHEPFFPGPPPADEHARLLRQWLPDQIVYQIFPDRFAIGNGLTPERKLAGPEYADGRIVRKRWDDLPDQPPRGRDYYGGDLDGVTGKLDYIHQLGATCLYLTPVFRAVSNHKYDTLDFRSIDPMFGGDAAFDRMMEALHRRRMRVVLDAVFNHVSEHHAWFTGRHADAGLAARFHKVDGREQFWRGHHHLPELDLTHPAVEHELHAGPDSVAARWLRRGIAGWRLDTTPDLGVPFIRRLAATCHGRFPGRLLWGEVMSFPGHEWCGPDRLDGVMNYYFRTSILGFADGSLSAREAGDCHREVWEQSGPAATLCSMNILSSHDTPRLMTLLKGDEARVRLALSLQFTLPGIPMIYAGEENGMEGGDDPDNRRAMVWDAKRWHPHVREHVLRLAALRHGREEWRRGMFVDLTDRVDGRVLAFLRIGRHPEDFTLVLANAGDRPAPVRIVVPYGHFYDSVRLVDLLGHPRHWTGFAGRVDAEVPPKTLLALAPDETGSDRYRFYKPRNRAGGR